MWEKAIRMIYCQIICQGIPEILANLSKSESDHGYRNIGDSQSWPGLPGRASSLPEQKADEAQVCLDHLQHLPQSQRDFCGENPTETFPSDD